MAARLRRTTVAVALLATIGSALIGSTAPAPAVPPVDGGVPLPIDSVVDMVVDGEHRHVFISDPQNDKIVVTDYTGRVVGTIPGLRQVWGLELSEDSETVYAAVKHESAIVAIDTETFEETARLPTGADTFPQYLTRSGDTLWFGYRLNWRPDIGWRSGVGSIDLSDEADPALRLNLTGPEGGYAPLVDAKAGTLVTASTGKSSTRVGVYRTKGGTLRPQASRTIDAGPTHDTALSPDGDHVVFASRFPFRHQVFRTSDLAQENSYPTGYRPVAVDIAPDGTVAAGADTRGVMNPKPEPDLFIFRPGSTTPIRTYDFGKADTFGYKQLFSPALAWTPDRRRLFTVTGDGIDKGLALQILTDPTRPERADRAGSAPAPHRR
ncbi:YncE family protein [Streptomyces sp. NPDC004609]|uniref:YncE family protein n=1 Tax=Streptomyces sp. NPDC004609 TaxID=3364704 RepID=UPI00367EC52E